jgi:hypothetical protein
MLCVLQADRFVKSGRALRRKMWWNNFKMKIVMGERRRCVALVCVFTSAMHAQASKAHSCQVTAL